MDLFKHLGIASDCVFCGCSVEASNGFDQQLTDSFNFSNKYAWITRSDLPIICYFCHQQLPFCKNNCQVCGLPLSPLEITQESTSLLMPCGECLKNSPAYDFTLSIFHYQSPINRLITQLKYAHQFQYLPLLTAYLLVKIKNFYQNQPLPHRMIPVPLHPSKLRSRGFNQSVLIAAEIEKHLRLPFQSKGVHRQKNTLVQSSLDAKQRQRNLKKAFRVEIDLPKHVAIVDDVVTTGATVSELAKVLRQQGASRIDVWSIARAYEI